ncbi:MAG: beta-ketoacyl-[acyl-carrier-protein] synthase family protein [Chloroflexota bacterium]
MTSKKRVVITGSGIASPLGNQVAAYCQNLYHGQYGIGPITTFDAAKQTTKLGASLDPIPIPGCLSPRERKTCSNLSMISIHCVEQAMKQAKLNMTEVDSDEAGVIVGSGNINIYDLNEPFRALLQDDRPMSPSTIPVNMPASTPSQIAIKYGLHGIVKCVSTACAAGFTAIADGARLIRNGEQRVMIAGGADLSICPLMVHGWERLRVLSGEQDDPSLVCRPFDKERRGIALGDGAAYVVLESYEDAVARGALILAELSGFFQNSDSLNLVKPDSTRQVRCINKALQQAGLEPAEIGMIYAHATATKLNDLVEYESLLEVFQERLKTIPLCGLKSMIGHTMGASGPMALIAALGTLQADYFYPIPNLTQLEEGMALRITTEGQILKGVEHILLNAFAFGGTNVSLVVSKTDKHNILKQE